MAKLHLVRTLQPAGEKETDESSAPSQGQTGTPRVKLQKVPVSHQHQTGAVSAHHMLNLLSEGRIIMEVELVYSSRRHHKENDSSSLEMGEGQHTGGKYRVSGNYTHPLCSDECASR